MLHLWGMETVTFDVVPGAAIIGCIREAIHFAKYNGWSDPGDNRTLVSFTFEGVTISVRANSDLMLIYRDWQRAVNGYIDKQVGPYPQPILTEEDEEQDARLAAKAKRQQQKATGETSRPRSTKARKRQGHAR